jgi:hypothetical protein
MAVYQVFLNKISNNDQISVERRFILITKPIERNCGIRAQLANQRSISKSILNYEINAKLAS